MVNKVRPLLKWAGGKRQLLPHILSRVPESYNCYLEPFIGGASVLLAVSPKKAIVNDLNWDLINVYIVTRDFPEKMIELLEVHKEKHDKEYFYKIRKLDRTENFRSMTIIEKAARIMYLNHTCYNGLYRVNNSGFFNTPVGRYKNPRILDKDNIIAVSEFFSDNDIRFMSSDYLEMLQLARQKDFIYLDPPYDPVSDSSSFTKYTIKGFKKEDQKKLKEECDRLNEIGAYFLQSNSDTEFIRGLYKDYFIETIEASRSINSVGHKRKRINEVLISNYKVGG